MRLSETNGTSKGMRWTGIAVSTVAVLFMLMDAIMKLLKPAFVVDASAHLGYAGSTLPGIGLVLLISTLLYIVPRSSILGAILLTGYLGGAVASNVRAGSPLFNVVFPVLFGLLVWGGLWLRDPRLRAVLPLDCGEPSGTAKFVRSPQLTNE